MYLKKYKRLRVRKLFHGLVGMDVPKRKLVIRSLTTRKVREDRRNYPPFYTPPDYSKNQVFILPSELQ